MTDDIPQDQLQATSDLNDIRALERSLPFIRYFMKEPLREIPRLEGDLTGLAGLKKSDRNRKLGELAVWRRIVRKLAEDRTTNRRILNIPDEASEEGTE